MIQRNLPTREPFAPESAGGGGSSEHLGSGSFLFMKASARATTRYLPLAFLSKRLDNILNN